MSAGSIPRRRATTARRLGKLLKSSSPPGLGMMARPGRELPVAHGAPLPAQSLLGNTDAELFPQPSAQIDPPLAHHAVDRGHDRRRQRCAMRVIQAGWLTGRLTVDQAVGTMGVELPERSAAPPRQSSPPQSATRHRKSPPTPTNDEPAPHPSTGEPQGADPAHQNHLAKQSA